MVLNARSLILRVSASVMVALAGLGAPIETAEALERLSDIQLDAVTAGGVEATALAEAWASGRHANTVAVTETFAGRQTLQSFRLRQVNGGLTIANSLGKRDVEYGYAAASARADGANPSVRCQANLHFTMRPDLRLVDHQRFASVGRTTCSCATFGVYILPD